MLPVLLAGSPLENIARDFRYTARTLRGNPGFVTVTLALVIKAHTTGVRHSDC